MYEWSDDVTFTFILHAKMKLLQLCKNVGTTYVTKKKTQFISACMSYVCEFKDLLDISCAYVGKNAAIFYDHLFLSKLLYKNAASLL